MTQLRKKLLLGVALKCVDGRWHDSDGLEPPSEMYLFGITRGLRRWHGKGEPPEEIIEEPGVPLPDPDERNAKIPKREWRKGLNGEPEPPWKLNWAVDLFDPESGTIYTFINSTYGTQRAVERFEQRWRMMQALRGCNVYARVKLDNRPMPTDYGPKLRPEFTVLEWRELNLGIAQATTPLIEHKAKPAAEPIVEPAPVKKKSKPGKPVKSTTISEEIDDDLPGDLAPPKNILKAG